MRVLTNFPFEMFGAREEFPFERIVSFGPAAGRQVGDAHFAYDVAFDAGEESLSALWAALPEGFAPEALLLVWPDQEPIPHGLEHSPIPVVAFVSDYNLTLPFFLRSWPFFDLVLCDRPGLQVLGRLPFGRVAPICQYSFRPDVHRPYRDAEGRALERDIDICFVGNLSPSLQRERAPYIRRVQALADRYRVFVGTAPQGEAYGRLLARSRIVFNRSIRGEANLRAFEAPACGALQFLERENLEIRDYFVEGEEIVLYAPDALEHELVHYLEHEDERAGIAAAGHARVQQHRLAAHLRTLPALVRELDIAARPRGDALTSLLGRGELLLPTWAHGPGSFAPFVQALRRAPRSALVRNQLAVAMLWRYTPPCAPEDAYEQLLQATRLDTDYLPARWNLHFVARRLGNDALADTMLDEIELVLQRTALDVAAFDGLVLPLGYSNEQREQAGAWCEAQRTGFTDPLLALHRDWLARARSAPSPLRTTGE